VEATLVRLFDAEREARTLHDALASRGRDVMMDAIVEAMAQTRDADDLEATVRLVCLARLLGEFDGAQVADALIDVLGSDYAEARSEAGEQLQGLAYDRFKEVALAVERALEAADESSNALVELPYILAEIPEGGVVKLIGKFLHHADGDVVAAAVEALVEVGDPAAIPALNALRGDERISSLGEQDEDSEVQVGELVAEAVELLGQVEDE